MNWYIGPWQWLAKPYPRWEPLCGFGALDLRPIPQQRLMGGAPGLALFFGPGTITDSSYRWLGSGSWHDVKPTGREKAAIPVRRGYTLKGDDLVSMLLDLFTDGSDADGADACKPLVPTIRGSLELVCGQRHSERFRWGGRHTGILRSMLRREFAEAWQRDQRHARKRLDDLCIRYAVDDWKEFVPASLHKDVPGRLPRTTTITESFDRADSGTVMGNDLSWTQVAGTWGTASNKGYKAATGSIIEGARADSDLSSDDHYSQVVVGGGDNLTAHGPAARFASAANTYYVTFNFADVQYIAKIEAGSQTNLGSGSYTYANDATIKLEANGSTIKMYAGGVEKASVTDSAITGNVRCGVASYGINGTLNNFEAADLGGGGAFVDLANVSMAGGSQVLSGGIV